MSSGDGEEMEGELVEPARDLYTGKTAGAEDFLKPVTGALEWLLRGLRAWSMTRRGRERDSARYPTFLAEVLIRELVF